MGNTSELSPIINTASLEVKTKNDTNFKRRNILYSSRQCNGDTVTLGQSDIDPTMDGPSLYG
jgi:hypothetical protein